MTEMILQDSLANTQLDKVPRGRYIVDPIHTRVLFGVSHFGISTFFGEFTGVAGTLQFDPAVLREARFEVSIPVDAIYTSSRVLDEELKGIDWLDAKRFPTVTFVSEAVTRQGDGVLAVKGMLTLHGVTKEVALLATFHGSGINPVKDVYTIGFDITGRFRRSDFGVTHSLPLIGDELQLTAGIALELSRVEA